MTTKKNPKKLKKLTHRFQFKLSPVKFSQELTIIVGLICHNLFHSCSQFLQICEHGLHGRHHLKMQAKCKMIIIFNLKTFDAGDRIQEKNDAYTSKHLSSILSHFLFCFVKKISYFLYSHILLRKVVLQL